MVSRELLGHASAHGRAVNVGTVDTEVVEHRDHVLGEDLGAVRAVGLVAVEIMPLASLRTARPATRHRALWRRCR
jgi:hypothetical protein